MYEMKDEYLTGIEMIDNEHRRIFEIADRIYSLLHDEFIPDKYDYIVEVIDELKDYARKHFADEEKYMEDISYKKIFTQKIEHNAFVAKMDSYSLAQIDESQKQTIQDLLEFVNNWLVEHILLIDKQIGK